MDKYLSPANYYKQKKKIENKRLELEKEEVEIPINFSAPKARQLMRGSVKKRLEALGEEFYQLEKQKEAAGIESFS